MVLACGGCAISQCTLLAPYWREWGVVLTVFFALAGIICLMTSPGPHTGLKLMSWSELGVLGLVAVVVSGIAVGPFILALPLFGCFWIGSIGLWALVKGDRSARAWSLAILAAFTGVALVVTASFVLGRVEREGPLYFFKRVNIVHSPGRSYALKLLRNGDIPVSVLLELLEDESPQAQWNGLHLVRWQFLEDAEGPIPPEVLEAVQPLDEGLWKALSERASADAPPGEIPRR